ncbi:MAG: ApaG domain [Verrucomicrobia bacterium]|nr:ApaG domain [Verrucomicrobiota bacterium]MBI3871333.1 ApaG domain [Verrucomicrobiota bacterium]
MNASPTPIELPGLSVKLVRILYRRAKDVSPDRPHCFMYSIEIRNQSDVPFTLKARKWVVTHSDGSIVVVEGDGVVGQTPTIPPGGEFSYESQHFIDTPSAYAEGSYLGLDPSGRRIVVRIPRFGMQAPALFSDE